VADLAARRAGLIDDVAARAGELIGRPGNPVVP
jgi:hypothetical protein